MSFIRQIYYSFLNVYRKCMFVWDNLSPTVTVTLSVIILYGCSAIIDFNFHLARCMITSYVFFFFYYYKNVQQPPQFRTGAVKCKELLAQRAAQFRTIQKRLLTRFKDKTPAPLQNLDTLLEGTYRQVWHLILIFAFYQGWGEWGILTVFPSEHIFDLKKCVL